MKDIIISVATQKREMSYLLASFVAANLVNLWAIIKYGSPMTEMVTSFFYVLTFTFAVYFFILLLRLLAKVVYKLVKK